MTPSLHAAAARPGGRETDGADERARWLSALLATGRLPDAPPPDAVADRARAERVHLLLAATLANAKAPVSALSIESAARLAGEVRAAAVEEVARARELVRVAQALEAADCCPVIFKGAALAYTHYEQPWLRPRLDVDLLVGEPDRERAALVLRQLGYTRLPFVSGRLVMYQEPFVRGEGPGLEHVVDLHWRVANPQAVSRVLSHQQLVSRAAVAVVSGGARLRVPCPADALVLACVHRAAHHQDATDLLWLFDIHLVAARLAEAEWRDAVATARDGRVVALCSRGLVLARDRFGTPVPGFVAEGLAKWGGSEPSRVFLHPAMTRAGRLRSDLRALGWLDRVRLMIEILLPPSSYMRAVHGPDGWLAWLYVRRILAGIARWFAPARRANRG